MATQTYDVVVVGSGAAGLLAAVRAADLGASVAILEKEAAYGGTSAMSGGGIWVPNNRDISNAGVADSVEDAFAYMRHVIPKNQISDETIHTYITTAPEMIEYLESIGIKYAPVPGYADYYPGAPGWKSGGRTMDCMSFDSRLLGQEFENLRDTQPQNKVFGLTNMRISEVAVIQAQAKNWQWLASKIMLGYFSDIGGRIKGRRDRRLTMGGALVGSLRHQSIKRNIPLRLKTRVREFLGDQNKINGVIAEDADGNKISIAANKAVVLASGGFEHNEKLRQQHLPEPTCEKWSAGAPGNTGDMIAACENVDAAFGLMHEAWWAPTVRWGERTNVLFFEKGKPNLMIVNKDGRRFMNESITYNSYGECIYGSKDTSAPQFPAFVVFDSNYRKKFPFGELLQSSVMPDWMRPSAFGPDGLLTKANSLEELARKLGVDENGLGETANRMKRFSETGVDEDFNRGGDEHDRMYGDPSVEPNPCLGPIEKPPFYGTQLYPGDIGTKGGMIIDNDARVQGKSGDPITNLYAVGNCTASIMGDKYPGAGCTLGPALTMAYRAASHLMANGDAR